MNELLDLNIGDEIDFKYCGKVNNGIIADITETKVFVRIPSSQIIIINKEDVI